MMLRAAGATNINPLSPSAFATYMLFGLAYSVVNIPYGSLSAVMTQDPVDRASLGSFSTLSLPLYVVITPCVILYKIL